MPGSSVPSNTTQTYAFTTIREDLSNIVYELTPTETPIFNAVGRKGEFEQTYHEWSTVVLANANPNNAEVEGTDVTADAGYEGVRLGNYTQLMDKVAQVSDTSKKVKSAGDITKMAKQVLYHTLALKRDMESRLLSSYPAVAGNASTARQTAGIFAFLHTNVSRGSGGANPTLSGTTTGYPNAGPTTGTARLCVEGTILLPVLESVWTNGGNANMIVVGGFNKQVFSTFTGNATRFKKAEDKKLVAAVDVYESDFGQLQIVPSRNTDPAQALVLDTDMVDVGWLQPMQNIALAKTGHSDKRMVWCEWGVIIGNERSCGTVADLTTSGSL